MNTEIAVAVRTISQTIDLAKKISNLAEKTRNAELIELMVELRLQLANSKNALADATEEVAELRGKVRELEETIRTLEKSSELVLKGEFYSTPDGDEKYCSKCLDVENKRVRVRQLPEIMKPLGNFECPNCKTKYN